MLSLCIGAMIYRYASLNPLPAGAPNHLRRGGGEGGEGGKMITPAKQKNYEEYKDAEKAFDCSH